jgi:hypothetical protein
MIWFPARPPFCDWSAQHLPAIPLAYVIELLEKTMFIAGSFSERLPLKGPQRQKDATAGIIVIYSIADADQLP